MSEHRDHVIVQIGAAAGNDIHHDQANSASQVTDTFCGECLPSLDSILICRADQLNRGDQGRPRCRGEDLNFHRARTSARAGLIHPLQ